MSPTPPVYPANTHNMWNDAEMMTFAEANPKLMAWINGHNNQDNFGMGARVINIALQGMVESEKITAYEFGELTPPYSSNQGWSDSAARASDSRIMGEIKPPIPLALGLFHFLPESCPRAQFHNYKALQVDKSIRKVIVFLWIATG